MTQRHFARRTPWTRRLPSIVPVVVMSPRPGRISSIIDIDLPRIRNVETRELEHYFHLVTAVREALRGDERKAGPDDEADVAARRVAAEGLSG